MLRYLILGLCFVFSVTLLAEEAKNCRRSFWDYGYSQLGTEVPEGCEMIKDNELPEKPFYIQSSKYNYVFDLAEESVAHIPEKQAADSGSMGLGMRFSFAGGESGELTELTLKQLATTVPNVSQTLSSSNLSNQNVAPIEFYAKLFWKGINSPTLSEGEGGVELVKGKLKLCFDAKSCDELFADEKLKELIEDNCSESENKNEWAYCGIRIQYPLVKVEITDFTSLMIPSQNLIYLFGTNALEEGYDIPMKVWVESVIVYALEKTLNKRRSELKITP